MQMRDYWWRKARLYELYIDKFAGDITGLISHLDYFTKLGVNTLHILPHYPSPMVDEGYDISDYRGVRPELGTLDDFKKLIDEAHKRDIRIITDFVLNHTSNQHPWFTEASSSKQNAKRDWYLWREIDYGFEGATNAFPDIKAQNWIYNPATQDYYFATFYPEQPDLNWDNEEVFDAMLSTMEFWAALGVDGFRLDAAPYLIKREGTTSKGLTETHQRIKDIRRRLESKYPDVILLAEAHQTLALTKEYFGDGDECHMAYHFPLMDKMWLALMENDDAEYREMIEESFDIPDNCQWATFLRNHDELAVATLPLDKRAAFIDFIDPEHRYLWKKLGASSVRVAEALKGDTEKILEAFKLLYDAPGAPVMYYGDEIGMRNLPLMEGVIDTRVYVRGTLDWEEAERQMKDPNSLFSHTALLVHQNHATVRIDI